jgi:hypothetical protein
MQFRDAIIDDLPAIVAIYNSTIAGRMVTADTTPVAVADKVQWFNQHNKDKRPLWIAEDDNKKTVLEVIHSYYYFGYRLWFDHYKKTYSDDTSNSLVNDKIREYFPDQDKTSEANLRKRKEKAIKIFKLFDGVGGEDKINCIMSFFASTISRLGMEDIDYVIAKV